MAFTPAYRRRQRVSLFVEMSLRAALVVGLALTSVVRIAGQAMADTLYASSFINGADHLFTVDPSTGLTVTSIDVNSGPIFGPLTAPADIAFRPNSVVTTAPEPNSLTLLAAALLSLLAIKPVTRSRSARF